MNTMTIATTPVNTQFKVSAPDALSDLGTNKVLRFGI